MTSIKLADPPYGLLAGLLGRGALVPFLGAGASLADATSIPSGSLPTGSELAHSLAKLAGLSTEEIDQYDLLEIASCFELYTSRDQLEERLQAQFASYRTPGRLHRLLVRVPAPLLIVTTNYDTLLESAFREVNRGFHLIMTPIDISRSDKRRVLWWPPGADKPQVAKADCLSLSPVDLPIIYKIHGGFDPHGEWHTSVVTEEDYFEIGGRVYETSLLPIQVRAKLADNGLLFLGYSLRDMHVRYLITATRQWARARSNYMISRIVSRLDRLRFEKLGVHVYELSIAAFLEGLQSNAPEQWAN